MTKRFHDSSNWDVDVIDTNSPGWTVRGGGAPTLRPKYGDPAQVPRNERYYEFINDATTDFHCMSEDLASAETAVNQYFDMVTCFSLPLSTVEEVHIYARGAGTATMTDFVRARIVLASGVIAIDTMVSTIYTAGAGAAAGTTTLTAGRAYIARFFGNAGAVSLKIWDAALGAAGEPAAFNLTPTGVTPTTAGWLGLGARHSTVTGRLAMFNWLATATKATTAVCPWTDAEFEAWMDDQTKRRCATMILRATGWDGATGTKKIYAQISNMGYNAQEQDTAYGLLTGNPHFQACMAKVPSFSVDLPAGFSGSGSTSVGELVVRNPRVGGPATTRVLEFLQTHAGGGGNNYTYRKILAPNYVIPAGARLKYDFWVDPANPVVNIGAGAIEVDLLAAPTNGRSASWADTLGDNCVNLNSAGAHYVAGVWYSRDLPFVASMIGGTITTVDLVNESDTAGVYRSLYRNIRITDAAGATLLTIWANGPPSINADNYSSGSTAQAVNVINASLADGAVVTKKGQGLRDDWLRYAWDRDGGIMRLGDPQRPYHDHRVILRCRVEIPKAPSASRISFKLADTSDVLNQDINTILFTSGDYIGQRKPELFGTVSVCELLLTDSANLEFTVSRRLLAGNFARTDNMGQVSNNLIPIETVGTLTIVSIDTALDEITLSAAHGMTVNWVFQFRMLTLPTVTGAALTYDDHFVISVPATNKVKISRTPGGASVDFTGSTTGAIYGYGYRFISPALMRLVNNPSSGRITAQNLQDSGGTKIGQAYAAIAFDAMGLSKNYYDKISFDALDAALSNAQGGLWIASEKRTGIEAFSKFAAGTFTWFCSTPDGRLQIGQMGLPSATALGTLTEADVQLRSMALVDVIRPVDMSTAQISYGPYFLTQGPLVGPASWTPFQKQNKGFLQPYIYGAGSVPIDNFPALVDSRKGETFEMLLVGSLGLGTIQTNLATFYKKKLGIFSIQTRLRAAFFKLGGTYRLKHGQLGWKTWDAADPSSPDNTATIDSELCVVVGKSFDLNRPHPVGLKLLRQIPGNFPTTNITT